MKNTTVEKIFACSIFPLTFVGVIGGAILAIERGFHPILVLGIGTATADLLVAILERVVPHCEDWKRSRNDIHVDAGHLVVSGILAPEAARPFAHMTAAALAGWLSVRVGMDLWPQEWPLAAQLALGLVIGEFPMYWAHRLAHEFDFLWRFHATHHSAPRLYWLNAARFHPVDLLLSTVPWYIVLVGLGANLKIVALYTLVSGVHGIFQHANLKLRLGPLNWIFSMAELHRWHHSRTIAESNTNYGQNLILWDIVFGTRFLPKDREPPTDIGMSGLDAFPMTYWAQILSPITWKRIKARSAAPASAVSLS